MSRVSFFFSGFALALASVSAHAADGNFDTGWGNGGRLQLDIIVPGSDSGKTLLIQPDGKLLMAGTCPFAGNLSMCAVRQLSNGSYDAGFGPPNHPGRVLLSEAMDLGSLKLSATALTSDGGSVYAGIRNPGSPSQIGLVVKLDAAGSFSSFGLVGTNDQNSAYSAVAIAVQTDGKIIVVARQANSIDNLYFFAISRVLANLSDFDYSFGDNGTKLVSFGAAGTEAPTAVALQADGKIVVVGSYDSKAAILRLLQNGQLDDDPITGFGTNGRALFDWGSPSGANAIIVDRDGSLLVAGYAYGHTFPGVNFDFVVDRLTPLGRRDMFFGATCPPPICLGHPSYSAFNLGGTGNDLALAMALQSDRKILVSGYALSTGDEQYLAVTRLTPGGVLDPAFGSDGFGHSYGHYGPPSVSHDVASAIAVGNGGIMVAGYSQPTTGAEFTFGIAKLQLDLIFSNGLE
jgi:uncharacterized delta-60 repeat protein